MAVVVTMKMMSSTRKMSVSGVMLMSAKMPPASASVSSPEGPFSAMGSSALPAAGASGRGGERLLQDLQVLLHEQPELEGELRPVRVEEVVEDDRLDGDRDAARGGHERLRDPRRHDREPAVSSARHLLEGLHDPDHRAEEADEGGGRTDGAEHPQVGAQLQVELLAVRHPP